MTTTAPAPPVIAAAIAEARAAEIERAQELRAAGRALGLVDFAEELVRDGVCLEVGQKRMVQRLADLNAGQPRPTPARISIIDDRDAPQRLIEAAAGAMAARIQRQAPAGEAERFAGWSFPEVVRELLERRGINTRGWSAGRVVNEAMAHRTGTTSDLPILLGLTVNRVLLPGYERAMSPLRKYLSTVRQVSDYRPFRTPRISDFMTLNRVPEGAAVEMGMLTESGETGAVGDYARNLNISNQALVNDDLGAVGTAVRAAGVAAAETEAAALVALLTANSGAGPTLADGTAMFATARGNLASPGTGPDVTSMSTARLAIRTQRAIDDAGPIAIGPAYVLSGAALETTIESMLQPIVMATQLSDANPWSRSGLIPLVEPRLTGNGWYLFGKPEEAAVLEVAYLEGRMTPTTETFTGPETLGITFRVTHSFGAYAVGWRGSYRNPGT